VDILAPGQINGRLALSRAPIANDERFPPPPPTPPPSPLSPAPLRRLYMTMIILDWFSEPRYRPCRIDSIRVRANGSEILLFKTIKMFPSSAVFHWDSFIANLDGKKSDFTREIIVLRANFLCSDVIRMQLN
jgi:hypothetical protein